MNGGAHLVGATPRTSDWGEFGGGLLRDWRASFRAERCAGNAAERIRSKFWAPPWLRATTMAHTPKDLYLDLCSTW